MWWRIKVATKVLFIGHIEYEGSWMADQRGFDGLRKWMNKIDKLIKQNNGKII